MRPRKLTIIGGGVSSYMLAILVREQLPEVDIDLITAESEHEFGGHLACRNVGTHTIEHGFHTLFGFYHESLQLLERVGAADNFRRSVGWVWMHESGRLHRCSARTLPTYTGASMSDKLSIAGFLPTFLRLRAQVAREGLRTLDRYDDLDFRTYLAREGLSPALLDSDLLRTFYDFGFNGRQPMSAAAGLKALLLLCAEPHLHHFRGPADTALMKPLRAHAITACRVRVRHETKLLALELSDDGSRVSSVRLRSSAAESTSEAVDLLALALDLESLRRVELAGAASLPSLAGLNRLETASSISLQAWFERDPVPRNIDNVIGGLPGPLSTLCPVNRVRGQTHGPFELMAVGPERDVADVDDEIVASRLWQTLRRLGFRIPSAGPTLGCHVHRNTAPASRYLLTLPGSLRDRPGVETELPNLFLAGAWLNVPLSIPSVEAAAQSARLAAEAIGRAGKHETTPLVLGMPPRHPLCLLTPYQKQHVHGSFFMLDAGPRSLTESLPSCLELAPGFEGKLLWSMLDYTDAWSLADPSGAHYSFQELVISAVVRESGTRSSLGLHPLAIYINSDVAVAAGREMFGFPKKLAHIDLGPEHCSVVRSGRQPGAGPGHVHPITLLEASWRHNPRSSITGPLETAVFDTFTRVSRAYFRHVSEVCFYLHQVIPEPGWVPSVAISRVLRAPLIDLDIHATGFLSDGRFTVGRSLVDPIYEHVSPGETTIDAGAGLYVDMSFGMAPASIIADFKRAKSA